MGKLILKFINVLTNFTEIIKSIIIKNPGKDSKMKNKVITNNKFLVVLNCLIVFYSLFYVHCTISHVVAVDKEDTQEKCADAIDNDLDNTIDCYDEDCSTVCSGRSDYFSGTLVQRTENYVDILFVVDNSNSMRGEQIALAENFSLMINELISPSEDLPRVENIHVGIVTTNLGVGGNDIANCYANGDDGILINSFYCQGDDCPTDCDDVLLQNRYIRYPEDTTDTIAHQFSCIAQLGTGGCGYEQPLEAAYRALTTQSNVGASNEGFLRDNAVLAIIFVTDEDDCSAQDTSLFDPNRTDLGTNLQTRCFLKQNEGLLYPLERYYDGFRALKDDPDNDIIVAGIVGLPDFWDGTVESLQEIKDQITEDPNNPDYQRVKWACESHFEPESRFRYADAAARIVNLIQMFSVNGHVSSICDNYWNEIVNGITDRIQSRLTGICLEHSLDNVIPTCRVIETLSDNRPCSEDKITISPYIDNITGQTKTRCFIPEAIWTDENGNHMQDSNDIVTKEGWYYVSTFNNQNDCPLLTFTSNMIPEHESILEYECLTPED